MLTGECRLVWYVMSASNELEETPAAARLSNAKLPVTDRHTASSAAPAGDQAPEPARREPDVSAHLRPASAAQHNSAGGHSAEEVAASPTLDPTAEQLFHSNPAACRTAGELPLELSVSTFPAQAKLQSCTGPAVLQLDKPASRAFENTVREVADSAEPALPMDADVAQADLGREGPPVNGHVPPEAEPLDSEPAPIDSEPAPMDSEPAPIAIQPADIVHRGSAIIAPFSQALDCLEVGDKVSTQRCSVQAPSTWNVTVSGGLYLTSICPLCSIEMTKPLCADTVCLASGQEGHAGVSCSAVNFVALRQPDTEAVCPRITWQWTHVPFNQLDEGL